MGAKKKEQQRNKNNPNKPAATSSSPKNDKPLANGLSNGIATDHSELTEEELLCRKFDEDARISSEARAVTGVWGLHAKSRDIKIDNLSLPFYGAELIKDTRLELSVGNKYG